MQELAAAMERKPCIVHTYSVRTGSLLGEGDEDEDEDEDEEQQQEQEEEEDGFTYGR